MPRRLSLILIAWFVVVATGVAGFAHERFEHADDAIVFVHDVDHDHRHGTPADSGHDDRDTCAVCHALHAPLAVDVTPAAALAANAVVGRVLDVQAQRLAAAPPARLGCRGPPAGRRV